MLCSHCIQDMRGKALPFLPLGDVPDSFVKIIQIEIYAKDKISSTMFSNFTCSEQVRLLEFRHKYDLLLLGDCITNKLRQLNGSGYGKKGKLKHWQISVEQCQTKMTLFAEAKRFKYFKLANQVSDLVIELGTFIQKNN